MKSSTHSAYHSTRFEYVTANKPDDFWVVTAYDPNGCPTEIGDNLHADALLLDELNNLGLIPFRVIGRSPDETHAEPGWGFPATEAAAIQIGKRFHQLAIYHFTAGGIDLVILKTNKTEPLDHPASRIHDPRDVRHFRLFVGSPSVRKRIDPLEYAGICTRVGALFPGFTIQRAEGCFQSSFEDTLVIDIATREPQKVLTLAHEIRGFLAQSGIGISHNGIYQSIGEHSDDGLILEAFGL